MRETVKKWLKDNNIFYDKLIFSLENKLNICKENNIRDYRKSCVNLIELKKFPS